MPSQPNSNKTQFPKCIIGRGWVSFLISMFFHHIPESNSHPQINVCRGCGKKFNTEELLGFHEKECLQCRPHRSEIVLFCTFCTVFMFFFHFLSRCDFCGQGFILAARLKHHRRSCHVRSLTFCRNQYLRIYSFVYFLIYLEDERFLPQVNPSPASHSCKVGFTFLLRLPCSIFSFRTPPTTSSITTSTTITITLQTLYFLRCVPGAFPV